MLLNKKILEALKDLNRSIKRQEAVINKLVEETTGKVTTITDEESEQRYWDHINAQVSDRGLDL